VISWFRALMCFIIACSLLCRSANCSFWLLKFSAGASGGSLKAGMSPAATFGRLFGAGVAEPPLELPTGACWPENSGCDCEFGSLRSAVWDSVVTTNLKTSKESGFSLLAAEIPNLEPRGSFILVESKQSFPSTETLNLLAS